MVCCVQESKGIDAVNFLNFLNNSSFLIYKLDCFNSVFTLVRNHDAIVFLGRPLQVVAFCDIGLSMRHRRNYCGILSLIPPIAGIEPRTYRLQAQCSNHQATAAPDV